MWIIVASMVRLEESGDQCPAARANRLLPVEAHCLKKRTGIARKDYACSISGVLKRIDLNNSPPGPQSKPGDAGRPGICPALQRLHERSRSLCSATSRKHLS